MSAGKDGNDLKRALAARAQGLGFDLCRIASPDSIPDAPARLRAFIAAGCAGDMDWLTETEPRRADPRVLWPDVRSIVMLGMNYGPASDPLALLSDRSAANISVYARNRDYHDVVKGKLKDLAGWLIRQGRGAGAPAPEVKVFVDTAPVMEKPLAEAAGLGWQGKHTNLVSRSHGSWLFLGSLFTTMALEADTAEPDHCGTCRACLDACPTNAFPAPYRLDARRCISYLTIEHKGTIPEEFRKAIGNRVYGCDDCLAVCPWNKWAQTARDAKLRGRADLANPLIADWLGLDEPGFRALFAGSPVKRIGRARFMRNLLIAAGNSGDGSLRSAVQRLRDDASPLVRDMATWALAELERLGPGEAGHDVSVSAKPTERDDEFPDGPADVGVVDLAIVGQQVEAFVLQKSDIRRLGPRHRPRLDQWIGSVFSLCHPNNPLKTVSPNLAIVSNFIIIHEF